MKIEILTNKLEKEKEKRKNLQEKLKKCEENIEQLQRDIELEEVMEIKKVIAEKGLSLTEAVSELQKLSPKVTSQTSTIPNQTNHYQQPNQNTN